MTKTTEAISPRLGKLEIVISTAMVAALASLTTAETIDISSVVKNLGGGGVQRAINKEWVIGSDEAITDYDTRLERGDLTIVFLYTNGKETLGTDGLDPYSLLKELIEYTAADLSVQFIWSPAGGSTGDAQYTTDLSQSFLASLSDPVGGSETNGKLQCTLGVSSPTFAESVVT